MFQLSPLADVLLGLLASFAPSLAPLAKAVHPHNPKALIMQGAAGKATVTYFTVPYNPEHLKDLDAGFEWHLGFAGFQCETATKIGGVDVPAGRYKMGVVRGETADDWDLLLEPWDVFQAQRGLQRARRGGDVEAAEKALAEAKAALEEAGTPARIVAPTASVKGADAEHLEVVALFRGFDTAQMFSTTPAGGMSMTLRMDFGDLHREVEVVEVFEKKD